MIIFFLGETHKQHVSRVGRENTKKLCLLKMLTGFFCQILKQAHRSRTHDLSNSYRKSWRFHVQRRYIFSQSRCRTSYGCSWGSWSSFLCKFSDAATGIV